MASITVSLKPAEKEALRILAERQRRDPRDQAALILKRGLEQEGLLVPDSKPLMVISDRAVQLALIILQACLQVGPVVVSIVAKALGG